MGTPCLTELSVVPRRHLLRAADLTRSDFECLFARALAFETGTSASAMRGRTAALLFSEPSTRTRLGFEAAIGCLGGCALSVPSLDNLRTVNGEPVADTVRAIAATSDLLIVRSRERGCPAQITKLVDVPVVNAGDGIGEHPSQAILDVYTMRRAHGEIDGLHIGIWGDVKGSRCAHSLLSALSRFVTQVTLVMPPGSGFSAPTTLGRARVHVEHNIMNAIERLDVVYLTGHGFADGIGETAPLPSDGMPWSLTEPVLDKLPAHAKILHPFYRGDELPVAVDSAPQAFYFQQMRFGLYTRMALLEMLVGEVG